MQDAFEQTQEAPVPFPVIRGMLKNKLLVVRGGAGAVAVLGFWLAFRTGVVDFYPVAIVLAIAVHMVLNVAVEVVELVAETLMPR
jgi:hypothetical protein